MTASPDSTVRHARVLPPAWSMARSNASVRRIWATVRLTSSGTRRGDKTGAAGCGPETAVAGSDGDETADITENAPAATAVSPTSNSTNQERPGCGTGRSVARGVDV